MYRSKTTYQEWRKGICEEIALTSSEQCEEAQRRDWFWVLDACAHPELPGLLWQLDANPDAWPLYMNTYMEESMHVGPWRIPCHMRSNATHWIFEQLERIPLGFLFSTNRQKGNIAFEHLQNILECVLSVQESQQRKNFLFRYYDPRIMHGLSTFHDAAWLMRIKGPMLSLHAWEPGRAIPVEKRYTKEQQTVCKEPPQLSQAFIDHLWKESQAHTIIGTLSGEPGEQLRAMPLPKAYQHVEHIQNILNDSPYTSNSDISFAIAYSLLAPDEGWQDILEHRVLTQSTKSSSLEAALAKAFNDAFTA